MMTEESLRLLEALESENFPGHVNQDVSFAQHNTTTNKNKSGVVDVTFAKSGSRHNNTTSSSGRNSSFSRSSKNRSRWSLPSETSLNDGVSLADRFSARKPSKGLTSEELQLDALKRQRAEKQLKKQKMQKYYSKLLNGKVGGTSSAGRNSVIKQ